MAPERSGWRSMPAGSPCRGPMPSRWALSTGWHSSNRTCSRWISPPLPLSPCTCCIPSIWSCGHACSASCAPAPVSSPTPSTWATGVPTARWPSRVTPCTCGVVPARVAGAWHWRDADGRHYRVELQQRYQKLTGELWIDGQPAELQAALLWGDLLELVVHDDRSFGPESIVMHCQAEQLLVVSDYQRGARARRAA